MAELAALARALRAEKLSAQCRSRIGTFEASAGAWISNAIRVNGRTIAGWMSSWRRRETLARKNIAAARGGGWELPASAWVGGRYYANYAGPASVILRRQVPGIPRARAFPAGQALDGGQLRFGAWTMIKKKKLKSKSRSMAISFSTAGGICEEQVELDSFCSAQGFFKSR